MFGMEIRLDRLCMSISHGDVMGSVIRVAVGVPESAPVWQHVRNDVGTIHINYYGDWRSPLPATGLRQEKPVFRL